MTRHQTIWRATATLATLAFVSASHAERPPIPHRMQPLANAPLVFRSDATPDGARIFRGAGSRVAVTTEGLTLDPTDADRLQVSFIGASDAATIHAGEPAYAVLNELRGSGPADWELGLPTFSSVTIDGLYPGVEVTYTGISQGLKSVFTLDGGVDPASIEWRYEGADGVHLRVADGALEIQSDGETRLVEEAPVAWQEIGEERVPVDVSFEERAGGAFGFDLGSYDSTRPLVIDPVMGYFWVFELGEFERPVELEIDGTGAPVALVGTYEDLTRNDIVVLKLTPDGEIDWITTIAGQEIDVIGGLALDDAGDVYLAGRTLSEDYPILNAMQPVMNGPGDAVITRLDGATGEVVFSTYFGGSRHDHGGDLVINGAGEIVLAGETDSTDFPTLNPIQAELNRDVCFCYDTFVTRLTADGASIISSTYFGGEGSDYLSAVDVDAFDEIYVAGATRSMQWPTLNPFQSMYGGGERDGFLYKFSSDAADLMYSTYLGGETPDYVSGLAVTDDGAATVIGHTGSADYPTTPGSFQPNFVGGILECGSPPFDPLRNCYDIFVTRLALDGSTLEYSTFIGGSNDDSATSIAIDSAGATHIAGHTSSVDDFPLGGFRGAYATRLSPDGSTLDYVVMHMAPSAGYGQVIAVNGQDEVFFGGATDLPSKTFISKLVEGDFLLEAPVPGRAGEANTLTAIWPMPDEEIYFAYSRRLGQTMIPGCGGLMTDLASPSLLDVARTDANGEATISFHVPSRARGQQIYFQSLHRDTCSLSNLVDHIFE